MSGKILGQPKRSVVQSLGKGNMFGEGGVLFDRLRSATVEVQGGADGGELEVWVVSREVFMNEVLPTPELRRVFDEKAFDGKVRKGAN